MVRMSEPKNPRAFYIDDHGARGDGRANDTGAVQSAVDAAAKAGGGTVVFPPGVYATGTVFLKSNISVYLEAGSEWTAYPDLDLFPDIPPAIGSRMDATPWKAFVYAAHQENIGITGRGLFHPRGDWEGFQTKKGNDPNRRTGSTSWVARTCSFATSRCAIRRSGCSATSPATGCGSKG
jgi:polygalacturonase